jgi:nucleotide-binding universal stress UspA family protein
MPVEEAVMVSITRVVCPVDFSDSSRHALAHAAAVAAWYEARLTVIHVFAPVPVVDVAASLQPYGMSPIALKEVDREDLLAILRRFVTPLTGQVPVDVLLLEAPDSRSEILAQAEALGADVLVMGAHGRSGVERLLLGSVTEKVLRKARCPVMVVPRHASDPATPQSAPFRRIVCAIDFSAGSERALAYALDFAQEADAQLTLLHAIEMPPELKEIPIDGDVNVDAVRAAAEAECLRRLRALVPADARTYCTVHTTVVAGRAHREILKLASAEQADLIVMGVQGRAALDLMLFGSNTQAVIRGASCPVLTVPQG